MLGNKVDLSRTKRPYGRKIRYIRDWCNGNSANGTDLWTEIVAYSNRQNVALNQSVTGSFTPSSGTLSMVTNGNLTDKVYSSSGAGLQNVVVDLGAIYFADRILVIRSSVSWGRIYYSTKTEVSADGTNWRTVFDSAKSGEYVETAVGRTVYL